VPLPQHLDWPDSRRARALPPLSIPDSVDLVCAEICGGRDWRVGRGVLGRGA
jgi:hypothetical protein